MDQYCMAVTVKPRSKNESVFSGCFIDGLSLANQVNLKASRDVICETISDGKLKLLLDKLLAADVLRQVQLERIKEVCRTRYEKVSVLTDIISADMKDFSTFCTILRQHTVGLKHLADFLEKKTSLGKKCSYIWFFERETKVCILDCPF